MSNIIHHPSLIEELAGEIKMKCSYHGKLADNEIIKKGKSKSGIQRYRCKICMQQLHKKNYEKNKATLKIKQAKYRAENKEKVAANKKKSRIKTFAKHKEKRNLYSQEYCKKQIEELGDNYIKRIFTKRTLLKTKDIPASLVEMKREVIRLKRLIKLKEIGEDIEKNNQS